MLDHSQGVQVIGIMVLCFMWVEQGDILVWRINDCSVCNYQTEIHLFFFCHALTVCEVL